LIKKTSAAIGDLEDLIWPVQRFSAINVSSLDYSVENREYPFGKYISTVYYPLNIHDTSLFFVMAILFATHLCNGNTKI